VRPAGRRAGGLARRADPRSGETADRRAWRSAGGPGGRPTSPRSGRPDGRPASGPAGGTASWPAGRRASRLAGGPAGGRAGGPASWQTDGPAGRLKLPVRRPAGPLPGQPASQLRHARLVGDRELIRINRKSKELTGIN